MNPILVATNFSPLSVNAALYAAALAKEFKSGVILFNAFRLPLHASNTLLSAATLSNIMAKSENRLKENALQLHKTMTSYGAAVLPISEAIELSVKQVHRSVIATCSHDNSFLEPNCRYKEIRIPSISLIFHMQITLLVKIIAYFPLLILQKPPQKSADITKEIRCDADLFHWSTSFFLKEAFIT